MAKGVRNKFKQPLAPGGPKKSKMEQKRAKIIEKWSIWARFRLHFGLLGLQGLSVHARASLPIALYYHYSLLPYVFHVSQGIALYPPQAPQVGVSQNYVGSMLLVSQLKLPSRSYRAIWGIAAILSQIAV